MARFNPYTDLVTRVEAFFNKLRYAHTVGMWQWKKDDMGDGSIAELYHRTLAAQQLGYEVTLLADDSGLHVQYRKKVTIPANIWGLP